MLNCCWCQKLPALFDQIVAIPNCTMIAICAHRLIRCSFQLNHYRIMLICSGRRGWKCLFAVAACIRHDSFTSTCSLPIQSSYAKSFRVTNEMAFRVLQYVKWSFCSLITKEHTTCFVQINRLITN